MTDIVGRIASPAAMLVASAATAIAYRRRPEQAARFAIGVPFGLLVSTVIKRLVREHRPRLFDGNPEESFPSSHSVATASYVLSLVAAKRSWWSVPLAVAAIAGVNASRVRAREHWPVDVIVGDMIGIAGAAAGVAAALAMRRVANSRRRRAQSARSDDRANERPTER
jgi:membrane-associated phospholipid phosphatase